MPEEVVSRRPADFVSATAMTIAPWTWYADAKCCSIHQDKVAIDFIKSWRFASRKVIFQNLIVA
jgi:hypothetical protein